MHDKKDEGTTGVYEAIDVSELMDEEVGAEPGKSTVSPNGSGEASADAGNATPAPEEINPNLRWYVVHTYSGYENRAQQSLTERIRQTKMVAKFGQVLVPTENVVELGKGGQKKTTKRKFFPGYMLVQMELNENTWHLVKGTPKIIGFVGADTQPPAVPEAEVRRLTQQIDNGTLKPQPRVQFEEGENVRVIDPDNPFQNFNGVVDGVNASKGKLRVLISIFGRSTPVELDFLQVEKA